MIYSELSRMNKNILIESAHIGIMLEFAACLLTTIHVHQ